MSHIRRSTCAKVGRAAAFGSVSPGTFRIQCVVTRCRSARFHSLTVYHVRLTLTATQEKRQELEQYAAQRRAAAAAQRQQQQDPEELVAPADALSRQALALVAENAAIEDALYYLDQVCAVCNVVCASLGVCLCVCVLVLCVRCLMLQLGASARSTRAEIDSVKTRPLEPVPEKHRTALQPCFRTATLLLVRTRLQHLPRPRVQRARLWRWRHCCLSLVRHVCVNRASPKGGCAPTSSSRRCGG
jgi:Vps23 core domain